MCCCAKHTVLLTETILQARTLFIGPAPHPEAPHACRVCRNVPLLCKTAREGLLLANDQKDISFSPQWTEKS